MERRTWCPHTFPNGPQRLLPMEPKPVHGWLVVIAPPEVHWRPPFLLHHLVLPPNIFFLTFHSPSALLLLTLFFELKLYVKWSKTSTIMCSKKNKIKKGHKICCYSGNDRKRPKPYVWREESAAARSRGWNHKKTNVEINLKVGRLGNNISFFFSCMAASLHPFPLCSKETICAYNRLPLD